MKKILIILMLTLSASIQIQAQFYKSVSCAIDSTDSLSAAIDTEGKEVIAFKTPAALTSTSVIFYTSADTTTANFKRVYLENSAYSITTAAARHVIIDRTKNKFLRYIKIETDSPEAADRVFTFYLIN